MSDETVKALAEGIADGLARLGFWIAIAVMACVAMHYGWRPWQ